MKIPSLLIVASITAACAVLPARAQDKPGHDADELAKQLSNPVAALISLPAQMNYDSGYAGGGWRATINVQPVVPTELNEHWNLISRVIVPFIVQEDVGTPGDEMGLGDVTATFFFSPKQVGPSGIIWGIGPALLLPTATNDAFASQQWGVGPSVLALKQEGKWTYGGLVNHISKFAGSSSRPYIDSTFIQPFLAYGAGKGRTYGLNLESSYDWNSEQWTVPLNISASQIIPIGKQLTSFSLGGRVYLDKPKGGPDWGLRLVVTLLFPK
ncbi:MAG: hypothetical protein WDM96_08665 [Lacunisphaera sp.]